MLFSVILHAFDRYAFRIIYLEIKISLFLVHQVRGGSLKGDHDVLDKLCKNRVRLFVQM